MSAPFDTHRFVKQLIASGFSEIQAETQVALFSEILSQQLATKSDISQVVDHVATLRNEFQALPILIKEIDQRTAQTEIRIKELDAKIEASRTELKRDIKELELNIEVRFKEIDGRFKEMESKISETKVEMIKWIISMSFVQTGVLTGILLAFFRMAMPH